MIATITHRDLAALLDAVARRASSVEIVVDNRLEQSIAATVRTDTMSDARATFTRYSACSMAAALEASLVDAAGWINAQPGHKTPIAIATVAPMLEVIGALKALLDAVGYARAVAPAAIVRARDALAGIGVEA